MPAAKPAFIVYILKFMKHNCIREIGIKGDILVSVTAK